ncbi:hypothetical protein, partial [Vibrio harveyi]|uniref:hypothetical protein n=1 Tax=Vibrio harveyi TaxID=669 RepID=UPI00211A1696
YCVAHPLTGLHGLPLLSTIATADNSGSDSSSTFGVLPDSILHPDDIRLMPASFVRQYLLLPN